MKRTEAAVGLINHTNCTKAMQLALFMWAIHGQKITQREAERMLN